MKSNAERFRNMSSCDLCLLSYYGSTEEGIGDDLQLCCCRGRQENWAIASKSVEYWMDERDYFEFQG
jgi:hypothetical protein